MTSARLILSCSLLALGACAQTPPPFRPRTRLSSRRTVPAARRRAPTTGLFQLFKESDEASLKRNPMQALFRGDYRYADRLGDLFSDAHYQARESGRRA